MSKFLFVAYNTLLSYTKTLMWNLGRMKYILMYLLTYPKIISLPFQYLKTRFRINNEGAFSQYPISKWISVLTVWKLFSLKNKKTPFTVFIRTYLWRSWVCLMCFTFFHFFPLIFTHLYSNSFLKIKNFFWFCILCIITAKPRP